MMQTLPLSGVFYSTSFVFFFQAEDGIRDGHVTGVQTCALPISCPCPIELCEVVHAPHAPSSSAKLLFWTRISTTSQSSAGVLGVVLGVVLGGSARSPSSNQW